MAEGGTSRSGTATEVFYEVALRQLTEQLERVDALDGKVATILAFASVVLPIYGGLLTLSDKTLSVVSVILLLLGGLAYLFLLVFSVCAFWPRDWSIRPDIKRLEDNCRGRDNAAMRWWVGNECLISIEKNDPQLKGKSRFLKAAIICLPLQAILLGWAALLTLA